MVNIPDIQPFRYQLETNIAEHNQIVDKVNEIIGVVNSFEVITDGLTDEVARLTSDIESINQSIGTINQKLAQHDAQIGDLDDEVNGILDRLTQIDKDISDLTSRMSTAEGEIDTLQGQMSTATGNITALQARMSQAETDIGAVESEVSEKANASDVTALTGRVGTVETEVEEKADTSTVTALSTRVTAVEEKNTAQDTEISELDTRITAVEGEMPDISYSGPFLSDFIIRMVGNNEPEMRFTTKTLNGATSALTQDIPKAQSNVYGVVRLGDLVVKNQGTANAGKALVVGSDGMVAPGDVGGGGGNAVWGQITGDIANQTDLQTEINEKANTGDVVLKNQGTTNAGKALVVGSDGMVAPGDVGGGNAVYGWENPSSFTTFKNMVKNFYEMASTVTSSALGHFNFKQYLPNSIFSQIKRIDLTISAVISNSRLQLTPTFCAIFPYNSSGDEVVGSVDIGFNSNGIDYIIITTADRPISFCDSTMFVENTEWEFVGSN